MSNSKFNKKYFLEVLSIENYIKNILLLSSAALLFEYNIMTKVLIIFEKIFSKENFKIIIVNIKDVFPNNYNSQVIHIFYIFSIFLEKMIYFHLEYFHDVEKYDIARITCLIICLKTFIQTLMETNFDNISNEFIQIHILKKLSTSNIIQMIIKYYDLLNNKKYEALNILLKLSDNEEIIISIREYLIYYFYQTDFYIATLMDLLSLYIVCYPDCKFLLYETVINIFLEKFKHIAFLKNQFLNNSYIVLTEKQKSKYIKILKRNKQYLIHNRKIVLDNLLTRKRLNEICLKLKDKHKKYIHFLKPAEYTEMSTGVNKYVLIFMFPKKICLLELKNREQLYQINIDTIDEFLEKNSTSFLISDILKIVEYDYSTRIIIVIKPNRCISLLFKKTMEKISFAIELKHLDANIVNLKLTYIPIFILELEKKNSYVIKQNKLQENSKKDNLKLKDKITRYLNEEDELEHQQAVKLKNKLIMNQLTKTHPIINSIKANYGSYKFDCNEYINCFLVSCEIKSSWLRNDDFGVIVKNKKILFIADYFIYIIKENFNNLKSIRHEEAFANKLTLKGGDINLYEVLVQIKIKDLKVIQPNIEKFSIDLIWDDVENNKIEKVSCYFIQFLDFSSCFYMISDLYKKRIAKKVDKKTEDFIENYEEDCGEFEDEEIQFNLHESNDNENNENINEDYDEDLDDDF